MKTDRQGIVSKETKLKFFVVWIVTLLCFSSFSLIAMGATPEPPEEPTASYTISNVWELQNMSLDLAGDYTILNDIDASITTGWNGGLGFNPIGSGVATAFTGTLNGNNYTISNLFMNRTPYSGLFGYASFSTVININLINLNVSGSNQVGGLVGYNAYGTITNCSSTGNVSSSTGGVGILVGGNLGTITNCYSIGNASGGDKYVGGFVGNNLGIITNCSSTGNASGIDDNVGGFAGSSVGTITNCYSTGNVSGGNRYVGGLVGFGNSGTITNCYSMGSVSGINGVGGLVGWYSGTITNCYSTGYVSGSLNVGGFTGSSVGTIISSYWDNQTSGQTTSYGGTGKNTTDMKTQSTFIGWDFVNTWFMIETITYPLLRNYYYVPIADAGSDDYATNGTAYIFDGSASYDTKGGWIINYTWNITNYNGTFVLLYDVSPPFTFWNISGSPYNVTLNITNNHGMYDEDWVLITVLNPHNPIRINNNTGFTAPNGVTGGSGTSGDPYIIDNWSINGTGSGSCIFIGNTTKYFSIEHNNLHNADTGIITTYQNAAGINLHNVTNGTVSTNNIYDNGNGIYAMFVNDTVIDNNTVSNNEQYNVFVGSGLPTRPNLNVTISNNTISYQWDVGGTSLFLVRVNNSVVTNNDIFSNTGPVPVDISYSGNTTISDNNIYDNIAAVLGGMRLYTSSDLSINNNIFDNNNQGINVTLSSINNTITQTNVTNSINPLQLDSTSMYTNISWCNFTGTQGTDINSQYNFIRNSTFERTTNGDVIEVDNHYNTFDNLTVVGGIGNGFDISSYNNCIVKYCDIYNVNVGIVTSVANNIIITGNTITNTINKGIEMSGSCTNLTISNNILDDCNRGIHIRANYNHLYYNITDNRIENCTIGIAIDSPIPTLSVFISRNTFINSTQGINTFSNGITVYHNNFINSGIHVLDSGGLNIWDNGYQSGGNYYDDYSGVDNFHGEYQDVPGGDNMGDTPQTFSPTQDNYPLMNPQETNNTPTADAGYDQVGYGGFRRLLGNESSDAGGSITNYTWNFTFNSSWYESYTQKVNFTFDVVGEWNVTLNVTDNASNVDTDYVLINITSIPEFFDDGIYSTAWDTSLTLNNIILDTTSDRKTVHKFNVSQQVSFRQSTIFNDTVNTSYTGLVVEWTQNMTLSDSDHINVTVDSNGNLNAVEIYETKVNINGQDFLAVDTKEGEWANWVMIITGGGTKSYVFVNGIEIGNQTTPYTGIADELLFELNEVGSNSSSTSYIDWVVVYNYSSPVANAGPDQAGYEGIYSFDGRGSLGVIVNYTWNFTHNATPIMLYDTQPTFNFTRSGNYLVTLNVTDILGISDEDTMWVNITNQLPIADAGLNQTYGRGVRSFNGTNSYDIDGYIINYTWNFTDGGAVVMYDSTPSYNFTTINVYVIMLKVTDDEGEFRYDNVTFNITNANPVADAGPNQTGKRTMTFDGSGSYDADWGTIDNYTWTFTYGGSPTTLYGIGPSFDFNISGYYSVTLNVTDNDGGTDENTMYMNIAIILPIADAGPDDATYKGVYNFDGTGSSDFDGSIINYTWNFTYSGSPAYMYDSTPSFDFQILGFYNVTLRVTDDDYRYGVDVMMLQILPQYPIADAGTNQTGKRILSLDGSGSYDNDGTITNYTWNFTYGGSPMFLYGVNPSFDFNLSDVYEIMLKVTDDDGLNGYDNVTVTVVLLPPVAVAGPDQAGQKGVYLFNGISSYDTDGSITNYTWTFTYNATPQTMYGAFPNFYFYTNGTYEVTLNVTDNDWRYGEDTTWVNITWLSPVADAGPNQAGKRIITFDGSGSSDGDGWITNYTWNFTYNGGPETLWGVGPSFDFNISGVYIVMLNVTDNDGLYAYDNVTITITITPPVANAGPDQAGIRGTYDFDGSSSSDSDGTIINYTWTFVYNATGQTLYGTTPDFYFYSDGNYEVTLNITDDDYRYDEDTMWVNITLVKPVPVISYTPFDDNKGVKLLDGTGSYDLDGYITNYTWTFTYDGTPYTYWTSTVSFGFWLPDNYAITLNLTDHDGLQDEITIVMPIVLKDPVANAGDNRYEQSWTDMILNGSQSTDEDGYLVNWTWEFTYDNVSYALYGEVVTFHLGTENGTINVTLTVTDDDGLTDTDTILIEVINPITAASAILAALLPMLIVALLILFVFRFMRKAERDLGGRKKGGK